MADCAYCRTIIKDSDKAILDGERWFCSHQCLGLWAQQQGGGIPA